MSKRKYVNFTFSIALAVGGYLIGEDFLHVSGVITTLIAAILLVKTHKDIFEDVRQALHTTYTGFITNSFSFFLIGLPLVFDFESLNVPWVLIIIAPFAILMI